MQTRARLSFALLGFTLMLAASLLGVMFSMRSLLREAPLSLLQQQKLGKRGVDKVRGTVAVAAFALAMVLVVSPIPAMTLDVRTMLLVVVVIVLAYAAAPVLVAAIAVPVGSLVRLASRGSARGSGLLAAQRSRRETEGSISVAMPVIMVLTIVVSFLGLSRAGAAGGAILTLDPLKADVVVSTDNVAHENAIAQAVSCLGKQASSVQTYRTQRWLAEGSSEIVNVAWADVAQLADEGGRASVPHVTKGSLQDLGPGRVAMSSQVVGHKLSDTVQLIDGHDRTHAVRVVALIDPPQGMPGLQMDFLALSGTLPQTGDTNCGIAAIAAASMHDVPRIVRQVKSAVPNDVRVETKREFSERYIARGLSGQKALSVMIVGGAALALIFLMQAVAIMLSERRAQNRRLHQLGVMSGSLTLAAVLETLIDVVVGIVIAVAAVAMVMVGIAFGFNREGIPVRAMPIPFGSFVWLALALLAVGLAVTLVCSWLVARNGLVRG